MHIGCKIYPFEEWFSFSDEEIDKMDSRVLGGKTQNTFKIYYGKQLIYVISTSLEYSCSSSSNVFN